MIDIINRWTGAILRHSETATTIAEAVLEACKSGADLRDADLRGADLSGADQYVIRIQGSRHEINAINDDVHVGCIRQNLSRWLEVFEAIGKEQGYTAAQIAEYGLHLKHIEAILALRKVTEAA